MPNKLTVKVGDREDQLAYDPSDSPRQVNPGSEVTFQLGELWGMASIIVKISDGSLSTTLDLSVDKQQALIRIPSDATNRSRLCIWAKKLAARPASPSGRLSLRFKGHGDGNEEPDVLVGDVEVVSENPFTSHSPGEKWQALPLLIRDSAAS